MNKDPHSVLGVHREATPEDLKRAYRRLAMRWHPDRNDHPEATERFKQIRAAYDHLTAVDRPEAPENDPSPADEAAPAADESVARAADIRLNLEISLEEAAAGCRQTLTYHRGKACPTCAGSGEAGLARTRFCGACHGSGRVRDPQRVLVGCADCGGRGFFTERICPDCAGSGRDSAEVQLEISVPPGMLPGDDLRLAGQGEAGGDGVQAGDLYLTLVIRSHPLFQLRGRDLCFAMPVSALLLIGGGDLELPVPGGVLRHPLEAGSPEARQLRLAGKGYPGRGKLAAGDLVVDLQPVFPRQLNARQRKLLGQVNAALVEDLERTLPEVAEWRRESGLE